MTVQIPEIIRFNEHDHSLLGWERPLPRPGWHNQLLIKSPGTHCWRGYQYTYMVSDERLVLHSLRVNLQDSKSQIELDGIVYSNCVETINHDETQNSDKSTENQSQISSVILEWFEKTKGFNSHFDNIDHPIDYTGGLLIGSSYVDYVGAIHRVFRYESVFELRFKSGRLLKTYDRSDLLVEIKATIDGLGTESVSTLLNTRLGSQYTYWFAL